MNVVELSTSKWEWTQAQPPCALPKTGTLTPRWRGSIRVCASFVAVVQIVNGAPTASVRSSRTWSLLSRAVEASHKVADLAKRHLVLLAAFEVFEAKNAGLYLSAPGHHDKTDASRLCVA